MSRPSASPCRGRYGANDRCCRHLRRSGDETAQPSHKKLVVFAKDALSGREPAAPAFRVAVARENRMGDNANSRHRPAELQQAAPHMVPACYQAQTAIALLLHPGGGF